MVENRRKYTRAVRRYRVFFPVVVLLVVCSFLAYLLTHRAPAIPRETIAVYGDPVIVWSWDRSQNTFTRVEIPADTYITAVEGYGTYSLTSLWRLGEIEGKGGTLFALSLEQALGIPVRQFVGRKEEGSTVASQSENLMSFSHMLDYLGGRLKTNVPFFDYVRFCWVLAMGRGRTALDIDLAHRAITDLQLPDGTPIRAIDTERWDILIGDTFEDTAIRKEAMPVAVYNTTNIPALGERVARLLGHIGVRVVTVGNDEMIPERCVVSGLKAHLMSETARRIAAVLGCERRESTMPDTADIAVFLGKELEKQYAPSTNEESGI